ncbi:pectate lyase [Paraflavitalea speifideaquila]|uniref:pectate lyase family protein n=1 Tax=Paraflavitalea speifideaquila TaxID=3076558 RepID=UPI0028E8A35E|nr:pectate lyase [Paraflavitalea speifideiaquila]
MISSTRTITVIAMLLVYNCTMAQSIAFPGAEGFGRYATGGREGKVFIVSNLEDAGPGSLREAVTAKMPRIIVFAVSGTIHLNSRLNIAPNVTIAGQSAPGDGICLADYPVLLAGDNIIIRYLRFRMGDKNQRGGMVDGNGADDALGGTRRKHIIIDHCSLSWSTDEVLSVYAGDSSTLQWNLIAEPLNYSYHFETGDKDYEHHGYGGIWGGRHLSAHHNLLAHCNSRTPRFDGIRNAPEENVDYRNNVIYNWGHNNTHAGEGGRYNIVNNYYKYGPSTGSKVKFQLLNPFKGKEIPFGKFYVAGNYVDGAADITANNWLGVKVGDGKEDIAIARLDAPFDHVAINQQSAEEAYKSVLQKAGANLPVRDTMDQRIIKSVKDRTGAFVDVQGGFPHGTAYELTTGAWPVLKTTTAPQDTDKDGMPDAWEKYMVLMLLMARMLICLPCTNNTLTWKFT